MKLFSWPFGSDEEAQEKERAEFLEYVQRIKEKRERLTWDCPFCKELVPLFEKRCTKCDGEVSNGDVFLSRVRTHHSLAASGQGGRLHSSRARRAQLEHLESHVDAGRRSDRVG